MTRKGDKLTMHMPSACLLFPKASIDDAATQVIHPLPLYDVIKDKLSACRRSQLTWRQSAAWKGLFFSFVVQSSSLFVLHEFSLYLVFRVSCFCYLEWARPFLERPRGSLPRLACGHRSSPHFSGALWPAPAYGGGCRCRRISQSRMSAVETFQRCIHIYTPTQLFQWSQHRE